MKNYRIVRLAGLHYPDTVQSFLEQHPDYTQKSYEGQLHTLFQNSPIFSDGFSRSFRGLGQEAIELVIDFEVLQKQWAKENRVLYSPDNWMFDIMMAQIEVLKPDVVYIQSHVFNIPGIFIKNRADSNMTEILKDKFPCIRLFVMFSGYPSGADRIKGVDILFAGAPFLVESYRRMGCDPILLYHSFDESIIHKLQKGSNKKFGFTFAGSSRAPESRYWALKQLLEETNLEMWIYEHKQTQPNRMTLKDALRSLLKKSTSIINPGILDKYVDSNYLPQKFRNIMSEIINDEYYKSSVHIGEKPIQAFREIYPDRCHEPVIGMDMYNLLHQSKVTFNKHTDHACRNVGNMRMFEATGVGACLITDTGKNMRDIFEADKEVVTYTNIDEAVEKVNYLTEHEEVASEIASAGQKRTLKDHTMKVRYQQIDEVIQKSL